MREGEEKRRMRGNPLFGSRSQALPGNQVKKHLDGCLNPQHLCPLSASGSDRPRQLTILKCHVSSTKIHADQIIGGSI